jgi:hypothetical protein
MQLSHPNNSMSRRFITTTKVLLGALLLVGLPSHAQDDEFHILRTESIGGLKIGMSAEKVRATIHSKLSLGPNVEWGADGMFHQSWKYSAIGLEVGMVAHTKGAAQTIDRITAVAPCTFATGRGIKIGSPEAQVKQAYKGDIHPESTQNKQVLIAGSVYGGMIFNLQNGAVSHIFLGAAAE